MILHTINGEALDATDKWVDYSPETGYPLIDRKTNDKEVKRINNALKKLGYSDSLISKILDFGKLIWHQA